MLAGNSEVEKLRQENERLKALLAQHNIDWKDDVIHNSRQESTKITEFKNSSFSVSENSSRGLSSEQKVALFRSLFQGRSDVFAKRWESVNGKPGYSPVCAHEWVSGICRKPSIKCAECADRKLIPLTDQVLFDHLSGKYVVGVYPLLDGDLCRFLAVDFDEGDWKADAASFADTCQDYSVPCAIEISRSSNGAHVWIFFDSAIPAFIARRLGTLIISKTCASQRQLELSSYDRLFPNHDNLPSGGFGNLIALPLQKKMREQGGSLFVDKDFVPFPDQWAYLASLKKMTYSAIKELISKDHPGSDPLDLNFSYESDEEPWKIKHSQYIKLNVPVPDKLTVIVADKIYLEKDTLPQALLNRIIRLAAFPNPEFYRAQAMRLPVWDKHRVIGCAENFPMHIALPRGCLDGLLKLLSLNDIVAELKDERSPGQTIEAVFSGTLRNEQTLALAAVLPYETAVLNAPTAFGKTVIAAAVIAHRKVSTLVLVHRVELLRQWKERFGVFLELGDPGIGVFGGGKKKAKGVVDIALIQTLARLVDVAGFLSAYGQIIIDECHHISALSFESLLKQASSRWVFGLTATPIRRDGLDPIIFMQCGPIRHSVDKKHGRLDTMEVRLQVIHQAPFPSELGIQSIFSLLATNRERNLIIFKDIEAAWEDGRKIIVLTERSDQLEELAEMIRIAGFRLFVLHGRMKRKDRLSVLTELETLDIKEPRVILATGKLVGEGFDHPSLDTLVLTMPISWKGTIAQYAGRLNRVCVGKQDLRIYDYFDDNDSRLVRMWGKRERGYRALGYTINRSEIK